MATRPSGSVRLLGAFDQCVLGPGTADTDLLPAEHRSAVSGAAGWIAPVVVSGGRNIGVWESEEHALTVSLFPGVRKPGMKVLRAQAARVAAATGGDQLAVGIA